MYILSIPSRRLTHFCYESFLKISVFYLYETRSIAFVYIYIGCMFVKYEAVMQLCKYYIHMWRTCLLNVNSVRKYQKVIKWNSKKTNTYIEAVMASNF